MTIKVKRVYAEPSPEDGYRVLVDRLWPRGLTKEAADVDLWVRDVAPTTELRTWYGHQPGKWPEFQERYNRELAERAELLDLLRDIERHRKTLTLLFAARDEERNEAQVLAKVLKSRPAPVYH
jgi:uncharacterized protein YeaO (DUF488 family)